MRSLIKNKGGYAQLLILISVVAGMITILSAMGYINTASLTASITGSGSYIERPVFYYDKCEAVSGLKYSDDYNIASNGVWANKPSTTNQYSIIIKANDWRWNDVPYISYSICNSKVDSLNNCRVFGKIVDNIAQKSKGYSFPINNIRSEEYVRIEFRTHASVLNGFDDEGISGAQYQIGFIPYGIRQYNVLGGSGNQINPNSCSYSTTQRDTIISTDADKVSSYKPSKNTNENVLQPEEVRWYVAGYLTSAEPSFVLRYKGEDAWCRTTGSSGEIYAINTIKTSGGTYKIASADWSDYLGNVGCCPSSTKGDEVCNDNFEWERVGGSECGAFKSCGSPNWVPYSENEIIKYSCVDGTCQSETKDVECASDFDCKDSNQVCDLNKFECEDANINLKGQVIETIPDSQASCEEKGGKWITQETTNKQGWLCFGGLGKCYDEVVVQEYCELKSPINWVLWIILIIVGIMIFMFRGQIFGLIKFGFNKIGVKI